MAKTGAVWGLDIGQCALKALRCRLHEEDNLIVADAFDYIEYPKILSQPDAEPGELVREAIELFLSRNSVRGDKVAISVSGQSGLARFIKLPPVESKKIPDIVKYEARQQIPFALEDVVWDYQQMAGGSEEDGFALETEVGLFAMKRDQVERALKPFVDAGIEVDVVQLTPLTIYNYTVFDQIYDLPPSDQYDPDNPPDSVVVISLGTDTTDLVITNGYRVWQRSVPLGGSHFTKALTKKLRLTFAKAEHLKKNAAQADDPKAVFQAMRPIFVDLLTEINRSIDYFSRIDRTAKIGRVIALGNAMKMPGLQKYLSQNLGHPVGDVSKYRGVVGDAVVNAPAFKENLLSFAVCYGLVLQGLGKAKLSTNLLPKEILTDRLVREKKPWAVAAVAALLFGCAINFFGHWRAWNSVHDNKFKGALSEASNVEQQSSQQRSDYETAVAKLKQTTAAGESLVGNVDGRLLWLEMLTAFSQCLPSDPPDKRPEDPAERNEIHIKDFDCEHFADLSTWYTAGISQLIKEMEAAAAPAATPATVPSTPPAEGAEGAPAAAPGAAAPPVEGGAAVPPAATPDAAQVAPPAAVDPGPKGPGWVIQIHAYHFHNKGLENRADSYVRDTLIKSLNSAKVSIAGKDGTMTEIPIKELGIGYPAIVSRIVKPSKVQVSDPNSPSSDRKMLTLERFDFTLQFAWHPTPLSKRQELKEKKAKGQTTDFAAGDTPAEAP